MWHVLQGIRILDLSRVFAGPAATQILGDLGADVIKIEEPGRGDEARGFGVTRAMMDEGITVSPSFVALNRNKRSMAVNLASPAGQAVIRRLVSCCDVVVNNFRPGTMERYGLGHETLRQIKPDLIYCQFSSYGEDGPLKDFGANDLALQAHSGLMSITGEADRPPVRCGTSVIDLHASLALVIAIMAALMHRSRTGEGQKVESSLLLSSAHLMNYFYGEYWTTGVIRRPMGTANHLSVPNQVFPSADGRVVIIAPADEMWRRCARALDAEFLDRPQWRGLLDRQKHRSELIEAMTEVTQRLASDEIIARLGPAKVNVAKVNDIAEAADHPQLRAAGGLTSFEMQGQIQQSVASPFNLFGTPQSPDRPPPELAAHTSEILEELGISLQEQADLADQGAFAAPGYQSTTKG